MDVDASSRQSTSLPSISMLEAKRADSVTTASSYAPPAPPPFSQSVSAVGTRPALPPSLMSPPHSRHASGDEQDSRPSTSRISLPSIHETLRSEPSQSYTVQPPPPPPPVSTYHRPQEQTSPNSGYRSYAADHPPHSPTTGTLNGFTSRDTSPYTRRADVVPPPSSSYTQAERPSYNPTANARLPSLQPIQTNSPVEAPRYPYSHQHSPHNEVPPPYASQPTSQPGGYSQNQQHPYSAPPTSMPPHLSFGRTSQPVAANATSYPRLEEGKRSALLPGQAYGESVKRHLETFDYERSLNEIAESGSHILEFADRHRRVAHQSQRSGLLPAYAPGVSEIDEMLRKAQMMQEALRRVKDVVMTQNVAATEQMAQDERYKSQNGFHADQHSEYQDESKATVFGGNDPKKRRGRAAPPGRCHSCNRAETPEWRRGPDGARTLCNACGLHYAKLTRKMGGTNKQPVASSNLRPKGPDSPTI